MIQKAAYTNLSQSPGKAGKLLRLIMLRGLVFLCLLNILNTIIWVPALQQNKFIVAAQDTQESDPDNSLPELLMEDGMNLPESASTPPDTGDEPLSEEEYLFNSYRFYLQPYSLGKFLYIPVAHSIFIDPHLESVTPPPKQV